MLIIHPEVNFHSVITFDTGVMDPLYYTFNLPEVLCYPLFIKLCRGKKPKTSNTWANNIFNWIIVEDETLL